MKKINLLIKIMEDFSSLTNSNRNYNEATKIKSKKKESKNFFKILKRSNSETEFIIITTKERRKIIRKYLRKKNIKKKYSNIKTSNSNIKYSFFKKGENVNKIIKRNKMELSKTILNENNKLKLFGNSRYNKKNPSLFVQDIKNKISNKKMGLVPMPSTQSDDKIFKEPNHIYKIQRNLSMTRRFQYNKKNEEKLKNEKDNLNNMIQIWWKKMPEIVKIQRLFRGFLIRQKTNSIYQLYKFMEYFEKFLINLILSRALTKLIAHYNSLGRKKLEGIYISKEHQNVSTKLNNDIILIQNNFRKYMAKNKRNFLSRKSKGYIFNKISFITKRIYINQDKINDNILKIQNNARELIEQRQYIDKNLIRKNNGFYYFDKVYLNIKNQKVIKFVRLMKHNLQLLAFRKKNNYKNPNEYNIDDLNKIRFIQKNYLEHYYNKIKHMNSHKINKNIDIKNSSFIRKKYIKNELRNLLKVQKMIKCFINRRKSIKNQVNKKHISINHLITKNYLKLDNCIQKITNFQKNYKLQFKKNKDNIINYGEHSVEESSYDDYSERDNKTLRQLTYKNRIPKKNNIGIYISKVRKYENKDVSNNLKLQYQKGIMITKKRYYNNESQIKKIQNFFRATKNKENSDNSLYKKPLINTKYYFDYDSNSSYAEEFLYSQKINNFYNYISKIYKYNIDDKIIKIQKYYLFHHDKNIKRNHIYKKDKIKLCFISKYSKKSEKMKQIVNVKFLLFISLFIKKNTQQYIFYLLKNDLKNFEYPFFLNTLNRILKYLNSNDFKGKNVNLLFNNIKKNSNIKFEKDDILLLNNKQLNQLRDTNICDLQKKDCLNYIYGFSAFDKKLKNEKFLNVRLINTKFNDTNIFTITKFIDNEFENFVKGKYCYKCYLDLNICKCSKEDDDILEIDIKDDYNPKNSIKFFEYDKNKGAIIRGKPKTTENDDIITKNDLINSNVKKRLILNDDAKKKNILINSRKNFEALKIHKNKQNILLRDDIEKNSNY